MEPGLVFNPEVGSTSGYAKRASVVTCVCLTTPLHEMSFYFYGFTPPMVRLHLTVVFSLTNNLRQTSYWIQVSIYSRVERSL